MIFLNFLNLIKKFSFKDIASIILILLGAFSGIFFYTKTLLLKNKVIKLEKEKTIFLQKIELLKNANYNLKKSIKYEKRKCNFELEQLKKKNNLKNEIKKVDKKQFIQIKKIDKKINLEKNKTSANLQNNIQNNTKNQERFNLKSLDDGYYEINIK